MRFWVLGAKDPEMDIIERAIRGAYAMEHVAYALGPHGERVRPEEAYSVEALSVRLDEWPQAEVVAVECGGPAIPDRAMVIDHHRPGTPGYGRPAGEYLQASSLGQVLTLLAREWRMREDFVLKEGWTRVRRGPRPELESGWLDGALAVGAEARHETTKGDIGGIWVGWFVPPSEYLRVAALDHCPEAARRGECPGVDPGALP
jgi:hypothetical protein